MLTQSIANVKCPQNHTIAYCKYNNTRKGLCVVEQNVKVAKWKSLHVQGQELEGLKLDVSKANCNI